MDVLHKHKLDRQDEHDWMEVSQNGKISDLCQKYLPSYSSVILYYVLYYVCTVVATLLFFWVDPDLKGKHKQRQNL